MQQEQALREQICLVGEQLHRFRLVDGTAGNISARLDGERVLVTPSGVCKGFMKPEQLIVLDLKEHTFEKARELYADLWLGFSENQIYRWLKDIGFSQPEVSVVSREEQEPGFETILASAFRL